MNVKQLTRTALLIALLVAVQYLTKSMGQFVTGSCVNLILAVAALIGGLWCGAAVAILSPFCAFLLGIGTPILRLVPAIALGNLVLVVVLALLDRKLRFPGANAVGVAAAAVCKFAVLWGVITQLLLPSMGLPAEKVAALSASFSWPQLVTALIGGALSLLVVPALRKALKG